MDCEEFREQICIDPARSDAQLQAHESECAACAAWAQRARRAETLINRALRFDTVRVAAQPARRPAAIYGTLAAAAVAGLAFWFGLAVDRPASTDELIAEILVHMNHEPEAVLTRASVAEADLAQVLAGEATIDLAALGAQVGPVTYANKCTVAGQWMSHLVVQSGNGPVTVLLIPEQGVESVVPLELAEQGLGGSIVPVGRGSIAVLGQDEAADAQTARRVAESVDITI